MVRWGRRAAKPKKPDTAFGFLTPAIGAAFQTLERKLEAQYAIVDLRAQEAIDLTIRPDDAQVLRRTRVLMQGDQGTMHLQLPFWADDSADTPRARITMLVPNTHHDLYEAPVYARGDGQNWSVVETAPRDLYDRLRAHVLEWYDIRCRLEVAKWVLYVLDRTDGWGPANVRYVMPGILPILRLVATSPHTEASRAQTVLPMLPMLQDAHGNDYKPLPPLPDLRQAIPLANQTIAAMALLSGLRPEGPNHVSVHLNAPNGYWFKVHQTLRKFDVPSFG